MKWKNRYINAHDIFTVESKKKYRKLLFFKAYWHTAPCLSEDFIIKKIMGVFILQQ